MDPTFPSLPLLPCLFKTSSLDSKEVAVILEASLKLRRTWGFFFLERGTHFRGSGVFPCFWAKRWLSFLVLLTQNCLVVEPTHLKNISQTGSFPQIGVKLWNHHPENCLKKDSYLNHLPECSSQPPNSSSWSTLSLFLKTSQKVKRWNWRTS